MWPYILLAFIIIFTYLFFNSPKGKGIVGEYRVKKILKRCALEVGGIELSNFMFKDDKSSSQIDNMLLTQKALYVIEVKNYNGYIFGNEESNEWTVTVKHTNKKRSKSGRVYHKVNITKHKFYNPIKQNKTHINKIKNLTNILDLVPVYNIVLFGKNAVIKDVSHSGNSFVLHQRELKKFISKNERLIEVELSNENQIEIIESLFEINIKDKKLRKEHVTNIKKKYDK